MAQLKHSSYTLLKMTGEIQQSPRPSSLYQIMAVLLTAYERGLDFIGFSELRAIAREVPHIRIDSANSNLSSNITALEQIGLVESRTYQNGVLQSTAVVYNGRGNQKRFRLTDKALEAYHMPPNQG